MSVRHAIFALIICSIWGVNFTVMKIGLMQIDPYLFGFLRFSIVFLLLLPWLKIVPGMMIKLFLLGNLIGGFQFALVFLAMDMTNHVSAMSVVVQLNIPITLIMAHFFLFERMSYWRTSGVLISFLGVLIITLEPEILEEGIVILIVVGATTMYSIGVIMMRKMASINVFQTQAWVAFFSVPIFFIMTLIFESGQIEQVLNIDLIGILMVLYTSILASIVGYGGINYLLKLYPVTLISPFMVSVPIFATIGSVTFLNEILSVKFILGAMFGGVIAVYDVDLAIITISILYLIAAIFNKYMPNVPINHKLKKNDPWSLIKDFLHSYKKLWNDTLGQLSLTITTLFWGAGATLRLVIIGWAAYALGYGLDKSTTLSATAFTELSIIKTLESEIKKASNIFFVNSVLTS